MIGCDIHQDGVDSELTTSGAVATLVAAAVVALTAGTILRSEVSSLAGLEVAITMAITMGEAMGMLHLGVIRMVEKSLVNR